MMGVTGDRYLDSIDKGIQEIRKSQMEMAGSLADLRVLVAGNYVTKQEFDQYREEHQEQHEAEESRRWKPIGIALGAASLITGWISFYIKH